MSKLDAMLSPPPVARYALWEIAHRAGVSERTIYNWTTRGLRGCKLESIRVGGRVFVTLEALGEFLAVSTVVSTR